MSSEKKVISLIFALVILMVFCVYTHLPQFMEKENTPETNTTTSVEKVEEKPVEESKDEPKLEVVTNEDTNKESSPVEEKQDLTNEVKTEETTNEEVKKADEKVVEEEKKLEEVEEENLEPLVTTDKRYNRTGNEKNIEDLSRTAQELQVKMSEFVKENPIIFKRDSFKVTAKSDITVKKVAEALSEFPNIKIEVAGHTDASGANDVNLWFSKERAKSVRTRLISLGVEKNRIKARGYGEEIPLKGINKFSKQNRRVEFNIIEE